MSYGFVYSVTSSTPGDYITMRGGSFNGPVVVSGFSPLVFTAETGIMDLHTNLGGCGIESACRNITITTLSQSPDWYCLPGNPSNCCGNFITTVRLGTIYNTSGQNDLAYTSYASEPTPELTTDVVAGVPQTLIISSQVTTTAWIDLNADNDFTDAGEQLTKTGTGLDGDRYTFTLPVTTRSGITRLRVRATTSEYGSSVGPCDVLTVKGETEDYAINVVIPPTCTGTTVLGNAQTSNAGPVCPNASFNLSVTQPPMPGTINLTYQWQVSTTGATGTFTDIPGQTSVTATITGQRQNSWYRLAAICGTSVSGVSAAINVTQQAAISCYCLPRFRGNEYAYINAVQLGTINNVSGKNAPIDPFYYYYSYAAAPTATQTTD